MRVASLTRARAEEKKKAEMSGSLFSAQTPAQQQQQPQQQPSGGTTTNTSSVPQPTPANTLNDNNTSGAKPPADGNATLTDANAADKTTSGEPSASGNAQPSTDASKGASAETKSDANASTGNASKTANTGKAAKINSGGIALPPEKASPVSITRFDKPPVIDGKLDEEVWQQAVTLKDFYQISPGDNTAPSRRTEVLVGYDSKTLYLGFRAWDEPDKVRATIAKRDNIFSDDYIGGYLDTFNDQRRAYVIYFNPLGVQADGIRTEGRGNDWNVDIVMDSKGVITKEGYTVEVAIPFKSLRYEAGKGKLWGAHFIRGIQHLNTEEDSWMPLSRDVPGLLVKAGKLTGMEGISTERTLEIIPSLTLSETGRRVRTIPKSVIEANRGMQDPGRFVNEPLDFDPGLTAKFGITPQVTLDLALNPDFAQVEADQLVVTANQRFPIFFAERRPFFLEGIDIFQTRITAVHTRAIVDPDYAVKLTGKQGRNTFGLLLASDNAPGNYSSEERGEIAENLKNFLADKTGKVGFDNRIRIVDQNSKVGVLRLKRDIGRENSLGLLATAYSFVDRHNYLGGFDGRFKFNKIYNFDFQVLGTTSRRNFYDPNLDKSLYRTGNGFAYNYYGARSGRNLAIELSGAGRTRDYRADVGFVQRTNTNSEGFFIGWFSDPKEKSKLVSWNVRSYSHIDFDWQGRNQIWESEYHFQISTKKQGWFDIGYERAYERIFEEEFGRKRTATRTGAFAGESNERSSGKNHYFIAGGLTPSKKYSFDGYLNLRHGHFDFDFGAGPKFPRVSPGALRVRANPVCQQKPNDPQCVALRDPGRGDLVELGFGIAYQPTDALRTTINLTKNRLVRHDTDLVAFDDNIISWRTTYQFTKFLFARARIDYTTLSQNAKGQFLFGWTPNPGTALYLGYNDDVNRNGYSPFTDNLEPGLRRNGRTFFIKASYLIRRSF